MRFDQNGTIDGLETEYHKTNVAIVNVYIAHRMILRMVALPR